MAEAPYVLGGFIVLWIYTALVYRDGYRNGRILLMPREGGGGR